MTQLETTEVLVADVIVGKRFRNELGDINAFAANIDEVGLLQPIGVTPTNELIFGRRRLEAAKQLGWEYIPARVIDIGSLLIGEWAENQFREDLTISERVEIGKAVEAYLSERNGSNQHKTKKLPPPDQGLQFFANPPNGVPSRTVAAQAAEFGNPETYRQAKNVVANGTPELVKAMDDGDVSISDAATIATEPEAVQQEAVKAKKAGKAKTARKAARPKETGVAGILAQADTLLGKVIRLVDDASRADRAGNRHADDARKGVQMSLKAIMGWRKGL